MSLKKFEKNLVVSRDKLKKDSAAVGKAAIDILSKNQAPQTVEETIEAMTPKYFEELMEAANLGSKEFESPFYVVVIRKKETIAGNVSNVLHHKYCRRQTKPKAAFLRSEFPNADHDVYEVNSKAMSISLLWTLPTKQDSVSILKNKHLYDPQLVKWIEDYDAGKLDSESYQAQTSASEKSRSHHPLS